MKKMIFVAILLITAAVSAKAQSYRDLLCIDAPCKYWVDGERFAFTENYVTVSAHLKHARSFYCFSLPSLDAFIRVIKLAKDLFIVTINSDIFKYDAIKDEIGEVTKDETEIPPQSKEVEHWGKKVGYCTAQTRASEPVLIIYDK